MSLAFELRYSRTALKQLKKLDRPSATRIVDYLDQVRSLSDPRERGKALGGDRAGVWRYRVGDFRVLCSIDGGRCTILALEIGHRSSVYD